MTDSFVSAVRIRTVLACGSSRVLSRALAAASFRRSAPSRTATFQPPIINPGDRRPRAHESDR